MTERLLTPSKIAAFLDCAHYLTLRRRLENGDLVVSSARGSMAHLLMDKGLVHEQECLAHYRSQGLSVYEVPGRAPHESFQGWVDRIGNPLVEGHDVIYQMPFVHDGMRGVADFLIRSTSEGVDGYEPLDAKLARAEAKPAHVLQLCFYADAIEALTGSSPKTLHIWLGSGRIETVSRHGVQAYWRRLRHQLTDLLSDGVVEHTVPDKVKHCEFCEFAEVCEDEWRQQDSLQFVANILKSDRAKLVAKDCKTLAQLATGPGVPVDIQPPRLQRLVTQAQLQVEAREQESALPPYKYLPPEPDSLTGFAALPAPDDGDIVLDYEGHPFWKPDTGLFFLIGLLHKADGGEWTYKARWAHDRTEEARIFAEFIDYIDERRNLYPGMHVYHYNHTERSSLERIAAEHDLNTGLVEEFVDSGLFVDLYAVIAKAMQVGTESYGLKHIENLAGFKRASDVESGAGAVVEYERYCRLGDTEALSRIAAYNEDDVRATLALRKWLLSERPSVPWRPAVIEGDDERRPDLDEQVQALKAFPPDSGEHLLGDLLGYWKREHKAVAGEMLAKDAYDATAQLADQSVVAGLEFSEIVERIGRSGRTVLPAARFTFPVQELGRDLVDGAKVAFIALEGQVGYSSIAAIDPANGVLDLVWNEQCQEHGTYPSAVIYDDWISPGAKLDSLSELASAVLDENSPSSPSPVAMALLRNDKPRFLAGHGPEAGKFNDHLDEMKRWALGLDASFVAIQGPPGSGKTYSGAHLIKELVIAGKRVGVMSNSHDAIDNLMREILKVMDASGELNRLNAIQKVKRSRPTTTGITFVTTNDKVSDPAYNLVAGTSWLFGRAQMRTEPLDVLIVDEAGQLALADVVAAAPSAKNLILLGDPQQLAHVSRGTHPINSGCSVLGHVLGGHSTIPEDRGVFLSQTRRLHPDVCAFISEQFYDSRLTSHEQCALQSTSAGTGLRWLRAEHEGCSTESSVEADFVVTAIADLIGHEWTNRDGISRPLTVEDFMVVAPYNDQVHLTRERLDAEPRTRGVRVGTVDKFQGQEAPVVFFTMTASSADDIPRGIGFLFSKNRLNVAISRAQALAYVICTEELLNSRARTVEEMELISALCRFVEMAE